MTEAHAGTDSTFDRPPSSRAPQPRDHLDEALESDPCHA